MVSNQAITSENEQAEETRVGACVGAGLVILFGLYLMFVGFMEYGRIRKWEEEATKDLLSRLANGAELQDPHAMLRTSSDEGPKLKTNSITKALYEAGGASGVLGVLVTVGGLITLAGGGMLAIFLSGGSQAKKKPRKRMIGTRTR
jgi:hypothetical protein